MVTPPCLTRAAAGHLRQAKGRPTFCEQKAAKKLCYAGPGLCQQQRPRPSTTKIFAPLFLKSGRFLLWALRLRLFRYTAEQGTKTRLGGDEFVIILEDFLSVPELSGILKRVVESVAEQGRKSVYGRAVTASLGATIYPLDLAGPEILLQNADEAMYTAKRAGGNQFHLRAVKPAAPPSVSHFAELYKTVGASAD
ncbi:GGDEF domain-containing protein [Acidocella sp.]|jgi:hypothetical protein|uniref:GGDEF domain-containing protein n=1 Tax=Acidocella sp. TaxID=50710 RepID=UPI002F3F500B